MYYSTNYTFSGMANSDRSIPRVIASGNSDFVKMVIAKYRYKVNKKVGGTYYGKIC